MQHVTDTVENHPVEMESKEPKLAISTAPACHGRKLNFMYSHEYELLHRMSYIYQFYTS